MKVLDTATIKQISGGNAVTFDITATIDPTKISTEELKGVIDYLKYITDEITPDSFSSFVRHPHNDDISVNTNIIYTK